MLPRRAKYAKEAYVVTTAEQVSPLERTAPGWHKVSPAAECSGDGVLPGRGPWKHRPGRVKCLWMR